MDDSEAATTQNDLDWNSRRLEAAMDDVALDVSQKKTRKSDNMVRRRHNLSVQLTSMGEFDSEPQATLPRKLTRAELSMHGRGLLQLAHT